MIKYKKSLGQNFLIDKNVLDIIVNSTQIKDKEVLEIGPGSGNLTKYILEKSPKKLFVVEKDDNLRKNLLEKFSEEISFAGEDILKIEEQKITKNKLTVFGNLPYNISTEIIIKWINSLTDMIWFDVLVLMFQKEVADRILANHDTSNYGRLSILANWKLDIKKIIDIKPSSFIPKPKVDSSLLIFYPKKTFFKIKDSKNLEKITRVFFSQRRKMLKKPFNLIFNNHLNIAEKLGIDLNLRPQNLTPEMYFKITKEFEQLRS